MIMLSSAYPVNNFVGSVEVPMKENLLVEALMSGNDRAFTRLYVDYSGALLGIISKIVAHSETSEDILQDTFVKIYASMASYNPSRGRLFTWMASIARNGAIDYLRSRACMDSRKNENVDDLMDHLEQVFTSSFNPDTIGIKNIALRLSDKHKHLVKLIYFEGYSQSEAAKELCIPLGTVKTRMKAAIMLMRPSF